MQFCLALNDIIPNMEHIFFLWGLPFFRTGLVERSQNTVSDHDLNSPGLSDLLSPGNSRRNFFVIASEGRRFVIHVCLMSLLQGLANSSFSSKYPCLFISSSE